MFYLRTHKISSLTTDEKLCTGEIFFIEDKNL